MLICQFFKEACQFDMRRYLRIKLYSEVGTVFHMCKAKHLSIININHLLMKRPRLRPRGVFPYKLQRPNSPLRYGVKFGNTPRPQKELTV